jgi:hypothetical protein
MHRITATLIAALAVSCSTSVTPTNPYDPATPPDQQAKAQLRGTILVSGAGGLADATVFLRQNGRIVRQTATASDGAFLFDAVVPGTYVFEVSPTGYVPVSMQLVVHPGDDLQIGDIGLTPAAAASALEGTATLAGEVEHGGTLVEAVGRAYTAVTNSQGQFRLDVAEGTYTLRMSHEGFLPVTVQDVTVTRGETRVLEPVALAANPGTIAGHVDAEVADGSVAPLAQAVVTVEGTSLTGYTNAAGDFALTSVPPGSYLVRVFKAGYSEAVAPVLDLQGGETRTLPEPFELTLSRGGLDGSVALADKPGDASGVVVEVAGTTRATVTGSDGSYAFDGLLEGTYALSAHKDGYAPRDLGTWTVTPGAVTHATAAILTPQGGAVSIVEGAWVNTRAVHLVSAAGAGFYKASESSALPGAWIAIPASGQIPFTLSDQDGAHTVWFIYSADGQTSGTPASAGVVLDRLKPSSPAIAVGDGSGWTRAPGGIVSLSLSALDLPPAAGAAVSGVARMQLSNDPAFATFETRDYALTTTWTLATPAADGQKTVYVRFVDRAGNVSDVASALVTLDRIAPANPSLALLGPAPSPAGLTTSPVVSAALAATDANGPLSVRLSNTPGFEGARYQPLASPASWTLLPGDGAKTVYAQFMDPAGNESLAVPATITLDTTGPFNPVITIIESDAKPTDGYTNVLGVTVSLSAGGTPTAAQVSESPSFATGVTVVQMAGLPQPVTSPFTLGGSGLRTVYARFQDAAGNWSAPASASVTVDATRPAAPSLTVTASLADGTSSSTFAAQSLIVLGLKNTDDAVEMATAQGAACATPWAATWYPLAANSVMLLDPPDGPKTVCVRTRDRAGNESTIATYPSSPATFELDTTPPTNPAFSDLGSTITKATSVSGTLVNASLDPPHAPTTVTYQCYTSAAGAWGPCTANGLTFTFALQRNANNVVGIRARDQAGNVSAGTMVSVVQDDTAPLPPNITEVQSTADSASVTWAPSADTDIDHFLVYYGTYSGDFAGSGAAQGDSPVYVAAKGGLQSFTLTSLDTGSVYYVAVEAVDHAGNGSGPSGQRAVVPNRVNPRLITAYGARAQQVAALVDGTHTYAYLATNQGVVQLDATATASAPVVIGRATVPNVVPDVPPAVFKCTHLGVAGHCVILAGTTLEGVFLQVPKQDRAFAPVVFFPTSGSASSPAVGAMVSQLPSRSHWLFEQDGADGPIVYSVEQGRAVAFLLSTPSFPKTMASAALPKPVTSVAEAAVYGDSLYVYGPIADPTLPGYRLQRVTITTAPQLALAATDIGTLTSEGGQPLGAGASMSLMPVATFRSGLYVAYALVNPIDNTQYQVRLCRYLPTSVSTQGCVGFDWYTPKYLLPSLAVAANGYVDVLVGGQQYPNLLGIRVYRAFVGNGQIPKTDVTGTAAIVQSDSTPIPIAAAAATSATDALERYLVLEQGGSGLDNSSSSLARWTQNAASPAATATSFTYPQPTQFAEWDHFLYAAYGTSVDVIDLSNPLAPRTTASLARTGRKYLKVVAHPPYLLATYDPATGASETGIDVFGIDGQGGLSFQRSLVTPQRVEGLAVDDGHVFGTVWNQIYVWDLSNLSLAPITTANAGRFESMAVVSRTASGFPITIFTTDYETLMFRVWGFDGRGIAQLGSTALTDSMSTIEVAGPRAVASGATGATILDVQVPTSPKVLQSGIQVMQARMQAGYLVGQATVAQPGGPMFAAYASGGTVDGFSPYSQCSGYGAVAHRDGSYYLGCLDNGILLFSAADGRRARLLERYDLAATWKGAALMVDGHDAYVGGAAPPHYSSTGPNDLPFQLFTAPSEGLAAGVASQPVATGTITALQRWPQWMLGSEGVVWSFEWSDLTSRASLVTYETASPLGSWHVRNSFDLGGAVGVGAQPLTDGRGLYVVRGGNNSPLSVEAYDVQVPSAPGSVPVSAVTLPNTSATRAMALGRDRLYVAATGSSPSPTISVLNVRNSLTSGMPFLTALPAAAVDPARTGEVTGIAVSGRWLFYTYSAPWPDTGWGLRVVQLGATNRDGAGATLVGELTSILPLSNPVVSGDRLFVSSNLGVAVYDLDPLFRSGAMPALLQAVAPSEKVDPYIPVRLVIDGPFAYLVGGSFRVYDLR